MKLKALEPTVNLKEPIKATDFVALEKIKDQHKTVGPSGNSENREMPRVDQQGSVEKAMSEAAKQDAPLTLSDWQWLKDVYRQAVLLDEVNRRVARQDRLKDMKFTDAEHAKTLSEMTIDKRIAANIAAAKELQKVQKEQMIRADIAWREWIDKIDQKTVKNKQELLEGFMQALGYKVGFIRQAWNQRHLTEIKKSLSKLSLEQQAEAQRLHIQHQKDLLKLKQEAAFSQNDMVLRALNESFIAKIFDTRAWNVRQKFENSHVENLLLLRAMGFKPGFLPLPAKQLALQEEVEKLARLRVEIENKEKSNVKDLRNQLAELQSAALSTTGKQKALKAIDSRELDQSLRAEAIEELSTSKYLYKKAKALLAAVGYNLNHAPLPWKRLEIEDEKIATEEIAREKTSQQKQVVDEKFSEISTKRTEQKNDPINPAANSAHKSDRQKTATQASDMGTKELPPLKPKAFKPSFPAISPKPMDISEQDEQLARLQTEKEQKLLEAGQELQLKLAQMQVAAQAAQAEAIRATAKPARSADQNLQIHVGQKVKAVK